MSQELKKQYETLSKFKFSGHEGILPAFSATCKKVDEWVRKNKIEATLFDGQKIVKRPIYSLIESSILEYKIRNSIDRPIYDYNFCDSTIIYRFRYKEYWVDTKKLNFISKSTLNKLAKILWIIDSKPMNIKNMRILVRFLYSRFGIHKLITKSNIGINGKLIEPGLPKTLYTKEYILDIHKDCLLTKRLSKYSMLGSVQVGKWWNQLKRFVIHY